MENIFTIEDFDYVYKKLYGKEYENPVFEHNGQLYHKSETEIGTIILNAKEWDNDFKAFVNTLKIK